MPSALPLDELYFEWLYRQVSEITDGAPRRTYWSIFRELFQKEFIWLIPNDDNRVEDGRDLRDEFLNDIHTDQVDRDWMELPCSFLEMLVALSRRLAFEAEGEPREWFWHLMRNLGLDIYNDAEPFDRVTVEDLLNTVIFRTYRRDGQGGLFPLRHARRDQRDVEIWYQLNAYLMENDL